MYYAQDPMASKTPREAITEAVRTWYYDVLSQNHVQVSRLLEKLRDYCFTKGSTSPHAI